MAMNTNTSPSPRTYDSLSDQERKLLRHVRAYPHHRAPLFRCMMRLHNGTASEKAGHLFRQEIAAADAKQAGEARS